MVRSMTGYGRGEQVTDSFFFTVEIKALNHRYLDLVIRLPRDFSSLEDRVRSFLQGKISRGRIETIITLEKTSGLTKTVTVNRELAFSYFTALQELERTLGLAGGSLTAREIAFFPEVLTLEKEEEDLDRLWSGLEKALYSATKHLLQQRTAEGKRLQDDLVFRLKKIEGLVAGIKKRCPLLLEGYRQKLTARLEELHNGKEYDRHRFYLEVALFAEKCNIEEELVRLESHLHLFKGDLEKDEVLGRKFDFLLQEINREVNTISSKSSDLDIAHLVVEAKSEIEKIREQVQNIE